MSPTPMITLYTWGTPNGRKVSIMLEECARPYRVQPIDIMKGAQFSPEFMGINPNSKIPAIVDDEGPDGQPFKLFESGAILFYLAEKTGKFLPAGERGKYEAMQWGYSLTHACISGATSWFAAHFNHSSAVGLK